MREGIKPVVILQGRLSEVMRLVWLLGPVWPKF